MSRYEMRNWFDDYLEQLPVDAAATLVLAFIRAGIPLP